MMRVSLIGTVHEEAGLANVPALRALLERITPDVIFLEIPPDAFDEHLDGSRSNLESTAVARYRERHQVDLIPVDLPTPGAAFFWNHDELYRAMRHRSYEYCQLMSRHTQHVWNHGFAYLNSEYCDKLFSDVHEVTLMFIDQTDRSFAEHYEFWTRTKERREQHMMRSIEHYGEETSFGTGAFLVGAAHRRSFMDKSASHNSAGSSALHWDFDGFIEADARLRVANACTSPLGASA